MCPSCGTEGMRSFYKVDKVPVHSCLMFSSEKEAREFPTGRIELGVCRRCGFVSNMAFDASGQDYSPLYEDQQCYSPTFNAFARKLAESLTDKYDVRNKNIMEVGCGKGDFLALMCEVGGNQGVGIDPACVKDRIDSPAKDRINIVQDYYSEKYSHYNGDFVMCRHTLEHIHPTRDFVRTVRKSIGDRLDTVVFFEIPDVGIVLRDIVFWDVYYEHCSYFSPGSLARLFRECGFEVLDIYLEYDNQYLLIDAKPVDAPSEKVHPLEESVDTLEAWVDGFAAGIADQRAAWKRTLTELGSSGKRPVIWGSGSKCVAFLTTLGVDEEIAGVVDINPRRHGKFIAGVVKEIMPPEFVAEYQPDAVIVMNPVYKDEISTMISGMGVTPRIMTV